VAQLFVARPNHGVMGGQLVVDKADGCRLAMGPGCWAHSEHARVCAQFTFQRWRGASAGRASNRPLELGKTIGEQGRKQAGGACKSKGLPILGNEQPFRAMVQVKVGF